MSEYTTITGELRGLLADISWTEIIDHMRTSCGAIIDGSWLDSWRAAADRACDAIDAIHANLERENESLRRELDRVMGEQDHDGWVELPKDADGEYIRIGDMMERGKARGHVIALMLSEYPKKWGGGLHWGVQLEGEQAPTALDAFFHHYHEPTVEDVLRELLDESERFCSLEEENEAIAEYAAKLRLAGE